MTSYQQSLARCIAYAATLTAGDPRFNQDIEVRHEDGSLWYLRNAFWMPDPEHTAWTWVITEHFGEMVFYTSEVTLRLFPPGPAREYRHHERCEDHGYTAPVAVPCPCGDCPGFLNHSLLGLLVCTDCQCAHRPDANVR